MITELLEIIVKRLVEKPDKISFKLNTNQKGIIKIDIHSDKNDIPKIIGKNGGTIKALNTIIRNISIKENKENVIIKIAE